jgi:hypothetical protein
MKNSKQLRPVPYNEAEEEKEREYERLLKLEAE